MWGRGWRWWVLLGVWCWTGCANPPLEVEPVWRRLQRLGSSDVLIVGEQHDAAEHQDLHRQIVEALVDARELAVLVVEMADEGHSTAGLSSKATEQQVQQALGWRDSAWPWSAYGPAVMAAVAADVPVMGGNLPQRLNTATLTETEWDGRVPEGVLLHQRQAVQEGHCGLLPSGQVAAMTRIQLARDARMAQTLASVVQKDKTVLLIAGSQHAHRQWGVPLHLPAPLRVKTLRLAADQGRPDDPQGFDAVWPTAPQPARDHCTALKQQLGR